MRLFSYLKINFCTVYSSRKHFAIRQQRRRKQLLLFHCKAQILYIVDSKIAQKYKRNTLLRVHGNTVSKNKRQYYIVHTLAILLKYYEAKGPFVNLSIRTLSQAFVYVQFTQIFNCKSNCLFIHYVFTALHGRDKKKRHATKEQTVCTKENQQFERPHMYFSGTTVLICAPNYAKIG